MSPGYSASPTDLAKDTTSYSSTYADVSAPYKYILDKEREGTILMKERSKIERGQEQRRSDYYQW